MYGQWVRHSRQYGARERVVPFDAKLELAAEN